MSTAKLTNRFGDNMELSIGDTVEFKCDVEQVSKIQDIRTHDGKVQVLLYIHAGEYGHGNHWFDAEDVWQ